MDLTRIKQYRSRRPQRKIVFVPGAAAHTDVPFITAYVPLCYAVIGLPSGDASKHVWFSYSALPRNCREMPAVVRFHPHLEFLND